MRAEESTALRLTEIDSCYATNISKRYYGIDDIAAALSALALSDAGLQRRFRTYLQLCADS
jgi:hypothetical protein